MSLYDLTFKLSDWDKIRSDITRLRKRVFMDEHDLPLNFLRHRDDEDRYHVIAYDDLSGRPIATGCIHNDGHIGRIAILKPWRETNSVAHVIVFYLMHIAKARKMDKVWLNAPMDSLDYFDRFNFFPMGEMFEYCGVRMLKIEACMEVDLYKYKKPAADEEAMGQA